MAAKKTTPEAPQDVSVGASIYCRFDGLTVGELDAFVKAAYALGADADTDVHELADDPMDPTYTVGLEVFGSLSGRDLHHFDA